MLFIDLLALFFDQAMKATAADDGHNDVDREDALRTSDVSLAMAGTVGFAIQASRR